MNAVVEAPVSNPMGLRERQRQQRERAILDAAFVLIAEEGYEAMTMDGLALRVGISKPTLYNHFPSKDDITVRTLIELNERTFNAIHAIDNTLPPAERLERVMRWMVNNRFSPTPSALLRARTLLKPAKSHPDYQRAAGRKIDAIADIVEAAQQMGDIDASMPPRLLAQMMFTVVCAPEYDDLIARGDANPKDIEETLVTMFFDGVRRSATK